MHALHFHRRRLRHTVRVTLVAWLFALCAGVVNACMLTPQGSGGPGVFAPSPLPSAARAEHASASKDAGHRGHDDPVAGHGHEQDAGKDGCLKFCDDESSALSKNKIPVPDPGVPLLVSMAPWSPIVPNAGLGTRLSRGRPTSQGPPLVIRFLRLTL